MRNLILAGMLLLFAGNCLTAQTMDFETRKDSLQSYYLFGEFGTDFSSATAKILSESNREQGLRILDTLLWQSGYSVLERAQFTSLYMHTREVLPDSVKEWIHGIWEYQPVTPPSEEYEFVVYYTSLYLASKHFPSSQNWFNGRSSAENGNEAEEYLLAWIDDVARNGDRLFDSPTYSSIIMLAMMHLAEFDPDSELGKKASVMSHWLMADFAHDYLDGQHVGAHSQEIIYSAMLPYQSEISATGWLYFGNGLPLPGRLQYFMSLCDYSPPQEIVELAMNRKQPFSTYERKRTFERIRFADERTGTVHKKLYMESLYAVGSTPGGVYAPADQHTWDVTWSGMEGNTTLFTMHPYTDPMSIASYYPNNPDELYKAFRGSNQFYATPTKTVGGSPYEHIFQHKNTVIALYDIPETQQYKFMTAFMPLEPEVFDADTLGTQWITMDVGNVYIGYYSFNPFTVLSEPRGRRLYSGNGRVGAVIQVAGKNEIGAYKDFRKKIRATKPDISAYKSTGVVRYTTIFGDEITFGLDISGTVNGEAESYPENILFKSTWIESELGSGVMKVFGAKSTLTLNIPEASMESEPDE